MDITVCHLPPGTSKWNRIEHRLFSHISMNWRGRPLSSHDVTVETIAATTTRTGLTVEARLDTDSYDTGVKVSDAQVDALAMSRHRFHGDWNYTLHGDACLPPRQGAGKETDVRLTRASVRQTPSGSARGRSVSTGEPT